MPVSFVPARPAIEDDAAAAAAEEAKLVVSAPVAVSWEGETVGTISPERLGRLVTFEPRGDRLLVLLDRRAPARVLDPAIAPHKQRARNAQFVVNGSAVSIAPSQTGTTLDADNAVVAVLTAAHRTDDRDGAARPDRDRGRPHDRRGARPRGHGADLQLHHRDGPVVVEPDPQRAPDGRLHRRDDRRAGRDLLVQRVGRPADAASGASSRARSSSARSCSRRSAAASARRRRRSSTTRGSSACRSSSATTTASTSRTTRPAETPRCRGAAPTSSSATTWSGRS